LKPKEIDDPKAVKPADWVDDPQMPDPNDKKPENWDQPATITDPNAKKPDTWDDEAVCPPGVLFVLTAVLFRMEHGFPPRSLTLSTRVSGSRR